MLSGFENIFDEKERNDYSSHFSSGSRHLFIYNDYYNADKFYEFKKRVLSANGEKIELLNYKNTLTRCILVKEEHARICKEELLILWTDFFKPEHLEKYPNLHETFWKAAKLCSKNNQEVNIESAELLIGAVDEIANIVHAIQENH